VERGAWSKQCRAWGGGSEGRGAWNGGGRDGVCRGNRRRWSEGNERGGEVAGVAPREGFEAEVEDAVKFVERDAHIEAGFGGGEPGAPGGLHEGEAIEIEPADGIRSDGFDGGLFVSFEPSAERGDAVFDKVEAGALHDIVFGSIGGADDFFGDAEGGTDLGAGELTIFEELEVGGGEGRFDDFGAIPEDKRGVGDTGAAFTIFEFGQDLEALGFVELFSGTDDEAVIGVIFEEAAHEGSGGEIRFSWEVGDVEGGQAAPEVEGVGEFFEPDFFGEEDLGKEG
jgi:hypothetical protein